MNGSFLLGKLVVTGTSVRSSSLPGLWSDSSKWSGGVPNADGAVAVISATTSAVATITLDQPVTLGTLVLGSGTPGLGYRLSGTGSDTLTFSNTGNSAPAQISVIDGLHIIDTPVVLASNLVVTSTSSNLWTLAFGAASSITDNSNNLSLTLSASNGTLILSGSDNYTGGTIVDAGTLIATASDAIPYGTSLNVGADGTVKFDSSQAVAGPITSSAASQTTAVPEPGTLALLAVAICGAAVYRRIRSAQNL